ncbi:hypothetical protein KUTeg_022468 [Tegillarca granosa]|uniref:Uncharacterized protein n=1 Tax=Tegillarca granosa TaxID=220873 RepID=A0ABQ9E6B3_TEGGR|nr:hypothetical protein KUTeg_022468 [Tegillarca granosa]
MKEKGLGAEKGLRPTSPVHVHVEDDVPVHVHVKQKGKGKVKKWKPRLNCYACRKKPKVYVPSKYGKKRQIHIHRKGPTHRLEINTPRDQLRMEDLSTDEEDKVHGKMKNYEKKIDSLMSEVGTLKNEVDLQRSFREIDAKNEILDASRHVMEQQERELDDIKDELTVTERQNRILRRSMEMLDDEATVTRVDREVLAAEREKLMKKLIEAEMDGQAAAKQIGELRDAIRRLREENRISAGDHSRINKQKDMLLEKLADFEATNRTLRRLLREQHRAEAAAIRLSEQRDVLMRRLAEADRNNERLQIELGDRDRYIGDLKAQLHAKVTLESVGAQDKIELDHLQTLLAGAKEKSERDKEALKKATRNSELQEAKTAVEQLNSQLLERETVLEDLRAQLAQLGPGYDKVSKEKSQILAENSALKTRLEELESLMDRTSIATIENKFKQADEELLQLRGNLKQYENLVEEYRSQVRFELNHIIIFIISYNERNHIYTC